MEIKIRREKNTERVKKSQKNADHKKIGSHDPIGTKKCNSFAKLFGSISKKSGKSEERK